MLRAMEEITNSEAKFNRISKADGRFLMPFGLHLLRSGLLLLLLLLGQ